MSNRDDFTPRTKLVIAKRVGFICSNPACGATTTAPQVDPGEAYNQGKAAHITAAAPGGPRYDAALTSEQRSHASNGIWLCTSCADVVDDGWQEHPAAMLHEWKNQAEANARWAFEGRRGPPDTAFAYASIACRFGLNSQVIIEGQHVASAFVFDPTDGEVSFYTTSAFVLRFMVQKNPRLEYVQLNRIECKVESREDVEYERLYYGMPCETSLYLIEIDDPAIAGGDTFFAERYFDASERPAIEQRFAPILIDSDVPETIDVRFNAKTPGLYIFKLTVVVNHGVAEQRIDVSEGGVFFEAQEP